MVMSVTVSARSMSSLGALRPVMTTCCMSGAVLEVVQDLVEVEVFVAQGDVEFVEQDQAVAVVLEHAGDFFPGVFGGFDVFSRSCVSQV